MRKPRWSKTCPGCRQAFGRSGYYRDASRPGGVARVCKTCHRARMQKYWKEDYYPAHRAALIEKAMIAKARRRAGVREEPEP